MQKRLKNIFIIISGILCAMSFCCPKSNAADEGATGGVNKYNDLVVSPTLAMRCGLSPENYEIDEDCVNRLAYDYATNSTSTGVFESYNEEKSKILGEYQESFLQTSAKAIVTGSRQEDELNKKICDDPSGPDCQTMGKDTLTQIRYGNEVSSDSTEMLINISVLRGSDAIINVMEYMLGVVVPSTNVDINDSSLAETPKN